MVSTPLFATLLCSTAALASAFVAEPSQVWVGSRELADNYLLQWRVDKAGNTLYLNLQGENMGWLGLGFGEDASGSMLGSDMVVVDSTEKVMDMFVPWSAFDEAGLSRTPSMDVQQDWILEKFSVDGDFTSVVVSRALDSEDLQDRPIVDQGGQRIIFAWGASATMGYHSDHRGASVIDFFNPDTPLFEKPADVDNSTVFTMDDYEILDETTLYICESFSIGEGHADIVAVEPIVHPETAAHVHHLLIHACDGDSQLYKDHLGSPSKCAGENTSILGKTDCYDVVYTWAAGGGPLILPLEAGFRDVEHLIIEMHYDNPMDEKTKTRPGTGLIDRSGFRLHHSAERREHQAGSVYLGDVALGSFGNLPAGKDEILITGTCSSACTAQMIPEDAPIHVFASLLHMHAYGKQAWTSHYTEAGDFVSVAEQVNFWNFEFQQGVYVDYVVNSGDRLDTHCIFDTTKAKDTVRFGLGSLDEMCLDIIFYYPAVERFKNCGAASEELTVCGENTIDEVQPHPDAKKVGFDGAYPQIVTFGNPPEENPTDAPTMEDDSDDTIYIVAGSVVGALVVAAAAAMWFRGGEPSVVSDNESRAVTSGNPSFSV